MTDKKDPKGKSFTTTQGVNGGVAINWYDEDMATVYANIGTATANREEFFLLFGTHQNWRGSVEDTKEVDVNLSTRVVMNPFAAKRLAQVLNASLKVYEEQFGKLEV